MRRQKLGRRFGMPASGTRAFRARVYPPYRPYVGDVGEFKDTRDGSFLWRYDPRHDVLSIYAYDHFEVDGISYLGENRFFGNYLRQLIELVGDHGGDEFRRYSNDDNFAEEIADVYIKTGYIISTHSEKWEGGNVVTYNSESMAEAWEHHIGKRHATDTYEQWLKDMSTEPDDEWADYLETLSGEQGT